MNEEKRETKEITTPIGKHKVILKSYITVKEEREIKSIFLDGMRLETNGITSKTQKIDARKLTEDAENKSIEMVVVSIDGKTNVVEIILEMHSKDGNFILSEIDKVTKSEDFLDNSQMQKDTIE
ncbi:MAG: hypothetical protein KAT66_00795 [Candidatus Lokiarchaeota archaeon]|nr:hypothetical protein [Candidatus Lokiarchaeota archaeon]